MSNSMSLVIRSITEYKHAIGDMEGEREISLPELPVFRLTIFRDSVDFGFTLRDCLL